MPKIKISKPKLRFEIDETVGEVEITLWEHFLLKAYEKLKEAGGMHWNYRIEEQFEIYLARLYRKYYEKGE